MAFVTFTLFRLPIVALAIVLDCLDPNQLFWLSLLSKKSSRLTKAVGKKAGRLNLYIDTQDVVCIRVGVIEYALFRLLRSSKPEENRARKHLSIGNMVFQYVMSRQNEEMYIYFYDNRFDLMTTLYEYATKFFGMPTTLLTIYDLSRFNSSRKLLELVLSRQESIAGCVFRVRNSDDEKLRYFLNTVGHKTTELLEIGDVKTSENFHYDFPQKLTAERIYCENATWMTVNHLYAMQSKILFIDKQNLSCEDMNAFLKNWINGGSSELCVMELVLPDINNEIIFTGLEVTQKDYPNNMSYSSENNNTYTFSQSFDIKKMDGTMASIILGRYENREFFMLVWPDFNGKPYPGQPMKE